MKEYVIFLKEKPVLIFLGFILGFEIFLQSGIYTSILKPNSYASNINRITENVISHKDKLNPDILVVGTSLAQEGILLSDFNESLNPIHKKVSSIAIPGSETLAQNLALEKVLKNLEKVKLIVHVVELERPWADEKWLESVNFPMIAEFHKKNAYSLMKKYEYDFSYKDIFFLLLKSIAYRQDLRDFFLNPPKRFKNISRLNQKQKDSLFFYENGYTESVSMYKLESLDDCMIKMANSDLPPVGSTVFHKKAILDTCSLMKSSKVTNRETETSQMYFKRLKLFYDFIKNHRIQIVSVLPPTNRLAVFPGEEERIRLWKNHLKEIGVDEIFEFQNIFSYNEGEKYFYDLFHLNREGAKIFTEALSKSILKSQKLSGEF
ncbi:MAG: hypothetical protein L6Q54_08900 [Leptospiraceae bacterium]|nr:hypothetical protein [Leptospiraceae bacterium]MCK6381352.1 hypothetical protein [Leptospiraceae bacterium]